MHNRAEARYRNLVAEVVADLQRGAGPRPGRRRRPGTTCIVDPGFGFGKTPDHNLALLRDLGALRVLGRPVLLGHVAQVHAGQGAGPARRTSAWRPPLATTALGIAAGVDMVRVHDVRENVRTARVADAILRGWRPGRWPDGTGT